MRGDPNRPMTVRMPPEMVERLDRLADAMRKATGGIFVARHRVILLVVELGLEALEKQHGIKSARARTAGERRGRT